MGRPKAMLTVAALVAASCAGCADDGDDAEDVAADELPLVAAIGPAIAALEDELGGAQDYFEITATAVFVTLWVAADEASQAVPYVFADGELADPAAGQQATGFTFRADDALAYDADRILDQVARDLPDSVLLNFSIVGGPDRTVRYGALVQSSRGGRLDVRLAADGSVLEAAPVG